MTIAEAIPEFTPERVTLIGALVVAVVAYTRGWIVSGVVHEQVKHDRDTAYGELKRDRDLWMNTALQAAHVAREQGLTTQQMLEHLAALPQHGPGAVESVRDPAGEAP